MLALFASFTALGVWQLQRLQWKLGLIAQVNANLHAPPISSAEAFRLGAKGAQYHRVALAGRFDNSKETYVYTTNAAGDPVYHVIAPFTLDDGRALMVDRGAVPERLRDPQTRAAGQRNGEQHVAGVWRVPDARGYFTPPPDLAHRIWFSRDVSAMAKLDGVKLSAPVIVEADAAPNPGGWPKGGQTVVTFRNDHLQYAITWFAMAAIVFFGWIAFHVSKGRIARR
ncbi:MAG TPA: SURF1 family protein [Rhizomicrobium sp.]|nr:SURF1 family protein [Rhizomicrobium sp.]